MVKSIQNALYILPAVFFILLAVLVSLFFKDRLVVEQTLESSYSHLNLKIQLSEVHSSVLENHNILLMQRESNFTLDQNYNQQIISNIQILVEKYTGFQKLMFNDQKNIYFSKLVPISKVVQKIYEFSTKEELKKGDISSLISLYQDLEKELFLIKELSKSSLNKQVDSINQITTNVVFKLYFVILVFIVLGIFFGTYSIKFLINLKTSQNTTDELIEALNSTAIVSATDPKGKIIFANKKFCNISKYTSEELIGKDHRILNSGLQSQLFFKNLWNTIKYKQTWSGQIHNKAKDGSLYQVQSWIVPIIKNDEIEKFISIRYDITDLNRSQLLLEKIEAFANCGGWTEELGNSNVFASNNLKLMLKIFNDNSLTSDKFYQYFSEANSGEILKLKIMFYDQSKPNKLKSKLL